MHDSSTPPQKDASEASQTHDENVTNDIKDAAVQAMKMIDAERLSNMGTRAPFNPQAGFRLLPPEDVPPIIIQNVHDELKIGRGDVVVDYAPEVDLTPYGAYRLGISRQHAKFLLEGQQLQLMDLGSRNGTQVNGILLDPHKPHTIADGDEIHFASMKFLVSFQTP